MAMTVKELMEELKKMPQDAKVLVHVKELGGFQRVELVKTIDGKGFEGKFGKEVVILDEIPFEQKKQFQEEEQEQENLCPECSVYCQERFVDGICK